MNRSLCIGFVEPGLLTWRFVTPLGPPEGYTGQGLGFRVRVWGLGLGLQKKEFPVSRLTTQKRVALRKPLNH